MLGVLCARSRPPVSLSRRSGGIPNRRPPPEGDLSGGSRHGGAASLIWHVLVPPASVGASEGTIRRKPAPVREEGSWNAAWDVRPARWLHGPNSAWMLFGVCDRSEPIDAGFSNTDGDSDCGAHSAVSTAAVDGDRTTNASEGYRVTGVPADGRCLFRAVVHGACLSSGKDAPDETRQTELADDLRAQVVDELLKRRDETKWFIEGDFDSYIESIQQPYVWGGEPELLMASHVLRMPISVFMIDRGSGGLVSIASYGDEYGKEKCSPIKVLFHGYGHYDALEIYHTK